jgi:endonuclease YncB( thermonuclease family)
MIINYLKLAGLLWFATATIVVAILMPAPSFAETLRGKVVGVTDGDTIQLLLDDRRLYKIRLGEIDAPEGTQPYGRASKRMLSNLIFGQTISARVTGLDRYGRTVAVLMHGKSNINAEMVKQGGAWAYRLYLSDKHYLRWEEDARQAHRGLWGLPADQIVAPWDWRAARRGSDHAADKPVLAMPRSLLGSTSRTAAVSAARCGAKRLCRQMISCEESLFHLQTCGVRSLDGDGNGVPCEKLCR